MNFVFDKRQSKGKKRERILNENQRENEPKPAITLKTLKKDFRGNNSARRKLITEGPRQTHTLKNRYRDLNRLINKLQLKNIQISKDLLKKKESLELQLGVKEVRDKEKLYAIRYHKVKFFERKKIIRRIKSSLKSNNIEEQDLENGDYPADLRSLFRDLEYILFYPKDEKYISLFTNSTIEKDELVIDNESKLKDKEQKTSKENEENQTKERQNLNRRKALASAKKANFNPMEYVTKYMKSGIGKKEDDYTDEANLDPEYNFEKEINDRPISTNTMEKNKARKTTRDKKEKKNTTKKKDLYEIGDLSDEENVSFDENILKEETNITASIVKNNEAKTKKRKYDEIQSNKTTPVDDSGYSSASSSSSSESSSSSSTDDEDSDSSHHNSTSSDDSDLDSVSSRENDPMVEERKEHSRKRKKGEDEKTLQPQDDILEEKTESMEDMDDFFLEEVPDEPEGQNGESVDPTDSSLNLSRRERRRQFVSEKSNNRSGMKKNSFVSFNRTSKHTKRKGY